MLSKRDHFLEKARKGATLETGQDYLDRFDYLSENRRFIEARLILEEAAEIFPEDYDVQLKYGKDRMKAFKPGERDYDDVAEHALERALEIRPDSIDARLHLASLYMRQRRDDEAIALYENVLEQDEDNILALCGIGGALTKHGKFKEAEDYLLDAYDLNPQDKITLSRLGHLYTKIENFDFARACFGKVFMNSVEARRIDEYAQRRLGEVENISGQRYTDADWAQFEKYIAENDAPEEPGEDSNPNGTMGG